VICKKCALGADLVTQLHELGDKEIHGENDYRARDFMNVARTLHYLCKGCDCQHHIRKEGEILTITPPILMDVNHG
jgi:hypothetical protein